MSEAVSPYAGFEVRVLLAGIDINATSGVFHRSGMMDTTTAEGTTTAEIGIYDAEPGQPPVHVYVDDVAVACARVPCD